MTVRPALHFTPASGWINDPHGIFYRDGRYEVFFQYVPGQTTWGPNCHWGHAVGPDLLSLTELPIAIAPGEGDDGIWTGSLVVDPAGGARVFYTSTTTPDFGIGRIRVARPRDDDWITWSKGAFVADAPTDLNLLAYRDPFVRPEGNSWRMFVGAAGTDGTAMALTYTSDDLESWTYDGVALQRSTHDTDPVWMGALWECPQILEIDDRAVMVSSVWDADVLHYAGYAVGTFADGIFQAEAWGRLTYGESYYAPSLFTDADGRPCLAFWMRGIGDPDAGWEGAHSVPHTLSLDGNRLVATPHPDVNAHRRPAATSDTISGLVADITWDARENGELMVTSGGAPVATLRLRDATLTIETDGQTIGCPVDGPVRVIVDGPVLEVSSSAGIAGAAIATAGNDLHVSATSGDITLFPLSRRSLPAPALPGGRAVE